MPILGSFELKTVLSQVGDKQPQEGALEATDILKLLGAAAFIIVQNSFFFFFFFLKTEKKSVCQD